jgi:hypothetical protein
MGTLAQWVATGVIPQLTLWMAVTVVLGMLLGIVTTAVATSRSPAGRVAEA